MNELNINMFSCKLGSPTGVTVYMPSPKYGEEPLPFYTSGKKFKVLWLLHGGNGDRNDWIRYTDLGNLMAQHDTVVICPDALNSDYSNHPEFGEGYMFVDFFFDELMPFIQNSFPVSAAPEDNFLGGASMGALAVWTLFLVHPERFGGIAPLVAKPRNYSYLEPYREMNSHEFRQFATENRNLIPAGYGKPDAGIWPKEVNMVCKFPTVGDWLDSYEHTWDILGRTVREGRFNAKLFLIGGEEDPRLHAVRGYVQELGIPDVKYVTVPGKGGHGYPYWGQFLPAMFDYFGL